MRKQIAASIRQLVSFGFDSQDHIHGRNPVGVEDVSCLLPRVARKASLTLGYRTEHLRRSRIAASIHQLACSGSVRSLRASKLPACVFAFALCLLFLFPLALHTEESPALKDGWLDGWTARTSASAFVASAHYEILLDHRGLAQEDGRDIRVFDSKQQPVSHFVCYSVRSTARILFDGNSGPGEYTVLFGNLSEKLPAIEGVYPGGRKEWHPTGGYSSDSFEGHSGAPRQWFKSLEGTMTTFKRMRNETIEKKRLEEEKQKKELPGRFMKTGIHASTDVQLQQHWYHVFRAAIKIEEAGKYEISVGQGKTSGEFGVLFVNGDTKTPAVPGWYTNYDLNFSPTGVAKFDEGDNLLELYTNNARPNLRFRPRDSSQPLKPFDGRHASFKELARVEAGPLIYRTGSEAETFLAHVRTLIDLGKYSNARAISKQARSRFISQPAIVAEFVKEFDRAETGAYSENWLTDGKFSSRTGAVPDALYGLPLKKTKADIERFAHEERHLSGSVWAEGRHVYGLPFDILASPYQVTSSVSVADGVLFFGTKTGEMHAVSLISEDEIWSFPGGGPCLGSPLVYRDVVYYGGLDRRLYALDAVNGRMLWNFPALDWIEGSPCAADGQIYFGSRDQHLYALDAELGVQRWKADLKGDIVSTPCTDGKLVYLGTRSEEFHAMDCASGKIVWTYKARAPIESGSCLANGHIYFGDTKGNVYALECLTGKPVWKQPAQVEGSVIAAPILVGKFLFGGTAIGKLWGIQIEDALLVWKEDMQWNGAIVRPAVFADGNLIFTSRSRDVVQPGQRPQHHNGGTVVYQLSLPKEEK